MVQTFVHRWRPWRLITISLGSTLAFVLILYSPGFTEVIAILGGWSAFVFAVLAVRPPPDTDVEGPPWLAKFLEWWAALSHGWQLLIATGFGACSLAVVVFIAYRLIVGPIIAARLEPSQLQVEASKEAVIEVSGKPPESGTLRVQASLSPIGKSGNCVYPATMTMTPIVDDQRRRPAEPTKSGEASNLNVSNAADRVAVSIVVNTQRNCRVLLTIDDAYYYG